MKNLILITGAQGSGKSQEARRLVSSYDPERIKIFNSVPTLQDIGRKFEKEYDVAIIEEVTDLNDFEFLKQNVLQIMAMFIITTQLRLSQIPPGFYSSFYRIIQL